MTSYDGFDESLAFIKDYIALHGPFDGLWAFSQVQFLSAGLSASPCHSVFLATLLCIP